MMDFPFHISLVMNNRAGFFFVNREAGVAVQRLTSVDQFSEAVTLLDCMVDDLAYSKGDIVLLDLSLLPVDFSEIYSMALIRFCLAIPLLSAVAVVGHPQKLANSAGLQELHVFAVSQDLRLVFGASVGEVVADIAAISKGSGLTPELPAAFVGGYGGSVYAWPEPRAVVVSLSGNAGDTVATLEALAAGFAACEKHSARVLVLDTTDFPALYSEEGLDRVRDSLVTPASCSRIEHFIHVRPIGDKVISAPFSLDVQGLLSSAGIKHTRVSNLRQAMTEVDKLQGYAETHVVALGGLH